MVISCDNSACVHVLNTGRGRDPYLLKCAREIWLLAATHDFTISSTHCLSASNTLADALSRMDFNAHYKRIFDTFNRAEQFIEREIDPYMFKLVGCL